MTNEKFRPGDRVAEKRKEYTVADVRNHLWRADDGSIYWRDAEFYELLPAAPAEDTRAALRALDELENGIYWGDEEHQARDLRHTQLVATIRDALIAKFPQLAGVK